MLARKPIYWDGVRDESVIARPRQGQVVRPPRAPFFRRIAEAYQLYKSLKPQWKDLLKITVIMTFALLIVMIVPATVAVTTHEIAQVQKEIVAVNQSNDELKVKVAELKSPTRIQRIAEEQLGMVLPDGFVYNSRNTVVVHGETTQNPIVD